MRVLIAIAVLSWASQAQAGIVNCVLVSKCVNTEPCSKVDDAISFTVSEPEPYDESDPLKPPDHVKFVKVWGLTEEFEAFPIGTSSDDVVGFWGHLRTTENILDPGYFVGAAWDQHVFTLSNGVARYSIHQPLKDRAIYLEGTCDEAISANASLGFPQG
jgi:hypothetical protein